ncbi:UNVERIFIED_CONTAM: hypothetical protein Scaly_3150600 [Sesamum calycinum]|uniref:Uncharacterized protein n=1 Tax=Sesamum calycinum TaxID=2727403 RepID=A0AAW2JDY3_9LAMI
MIPMLLFGFFPPSVVSSARRASPARSVDEEPLAVAPPYLASLTTSPNARYLLILLLCLTQASANISHPPNPPAPLDLTVQMFPETTVTHLDSALSDHAPIIISTTGYVVTPTALSRPWRSEAHWLQGPECEEVIKMGWVRMGGITRQELYWQQRRKIHWLRDGDRNTSFFHAKASSRRRVNAIDRLRDEGGRWIDDPAALRRLIERHFSRVFNSDQPSTTEIERAWNTLHAELKH